MVAGNVIREAYHSSYFGTHSDTTTRPASLALIAGPFGLEAIMMACGGIWIPALVASGYQRWWHLDTSVGGMLVHRFGESHMATAITGGIRWFWLPAARGERSKPSLCQRAGGLLTQ